VSHTRPWALVLGVSSGSGEAIARAVARDPGLNVVGFHRGHYVDQAAALELDVRAAGRAVALPLGDAGTAEGAAHLAEQVEQICGKRSVGLFVHAIANASVGCLTSRDGTHISADRLDKTMNSMANSFVYWIQALYERDLLAPRARMFGLSNVLTDSNLATGSVIAPAKAALEQYTRQLAMELGPLGHRVNVIKYSTTVTPALHHVLDEAAMGRLERTHAQATPARRMLTTPEVGALVSLLMRDEAYWFNGATIDFTGGMSQHLLEILMNPPDEAAPGAADRDTNGGVGP
jgi:3-oxoacyl-[acyl-carrier protein] reductase